MRTYWLPLLPAALSLGLLPPPAYAYSLRAQVGFRLGLENSVQPFLVYHAAAGRNDNSSTAAAAAGAPPAGMLGGGGRPPHRYGRFFDARTFVPPKNYATDKETAESASPAGIGLAEPRRQSRRLECPPESERDFVNPEARSYDERAREAVSLNQALHFQSKWRYFDLREWVYYVQCLTSHFADKFEPGQVVFDSGSGAGAFVRALDAVHPGMEFYGTDLSPAQIDFANEHVYKDAFCVANSLNIGWVREQFPQGFDHVISNGVMFLACRDLDESFQFVQHMVDLAKPGGYVWLGTVNDLEKRKDKNSRNCYQWDGGSGRLFHDRQWWLDNMDAWGTASLQIVEESDACRALYDSDRCRYSVLMRKRGGRMPPPRARKYKEPLVQKLLRQVEAMQAMKQNKTMASNRPVSLKKVDRMTEQPESQQKVESGEWSWNIAYTNLFFMSLVLLFGIVSFNRRKISASPKNGADLPRNSYFSPKRAGGASPGKSSPNTDTVRKCKKRFHI